jgi:hypothetical protein
MVDWFREYDVSTAERRNCGLEVTPLSDPITGKPLRSRFLRSVPGLGEVATAFGIIYVHADGTSATKVDISERYRHLVRSNANLTGEDCDAKVFVELHACHSRIAKLEKQLLGMTHSLEQEKERRQAAESEQITG